MSGLIWVQTVCKGYQQTSLVGKELNDPDKNVYAITYENCSYHVCIEMNMNSYRVNLDIHHHLLLYCVCTSREGSDETAQTCWLV